LFTDDRIYKVDISTAACASTPYVADQVTGFGRFGMGFVSDQPGSAAETLYLGGTYGIGKLAFPALTVTQVGTFGIATGPAEMTGTGDARLFAFFGGSPAIVAEVDKSTSLLLSQAPQSSVNTGSGWAFAFWGGDFWLFTAPSGTSQVDRYQPSINKTSTVSTNLGFTIVGAGVSTCAPLKPPG
jgi:hypothetical protein